MNIVFYHYPNLQEKNNKIEFFVISSYYGIKYLFEINILNKEILLLFSEENDKNAHLSRVFHSFLIILVIFQKE